MFLLKKLTTIRRQSWHYRLASKIFKTKELDDISACKYWCDVVPSSIFVASLLGLMALAAVGGGLVTVGMFAYAAVTKPVVLIEIVSGTLGVLGLFVAVIYLGDRVHKKVAWRCPPLAVKD